MVEPAGPDGMWADWLELPYPCGRARPPGASGPALSGVYATHETAHPLCAVMEALCIAARIELRSERGMRAELWFKPPSVQRAIGEWQHPQEYRDRNQRAQEEHEGKLFRENKFTHNLSVFGLNLLS
jgi:hypothetical protein